MKEEGPTSSSIASGECNYSRYWLTLKTRKALGATPRPIRNNIHHFCPYMHPTPNSSVGLGVEDLKRSIPLTFLLKYLKFLLSNRNSLPDPKHTPISFLGCSLKEDSTSHNIISRRLIPHQVLLFPPGLY